MLAEIAPEGLPRGPVVAAGVRFDPLRGEQRPEQAVPDGESVRRSISQPRRRQRRETLAEKRPHLFPDVVRSR